MRGEDGEPRKFPKGEWVVEGHWVQQLNSRAASAKDRNYYELFDEAWWKAGRAVEKMKWKDAPTVVVLSSEVLGPVELYGPLPEAECKRFRQSGSPGEIYRLPTEELERIEVTMDD